MEALSFSSGLLYRSPGFTLAFSGCYLDDFYKFSKVNKIKSAANSIEKNIDSENMDTLIADLSLNNDIYIEILSENGDVLYSSHVLKNCIIHSMSTFEKTALISRTNASRGELLQYFDRTSIDRPNGNINGEIPDIPFKGPAPENDPQQRHYLF